MPAETRTLPDGTIVQRYRIIGTNETVYRAYRRTSGAHHSIMYVGAACYGDVATERPPADVDALPARSAERYAAVMKWYAGRYDEAYSLIFQAYPEAKAAGRTTFGPEPRGYRMDSGSVSVFS